MMEHEALPRFADGEVNSFGIADFGQRFLGLTSYERSELFGEFPCEFHEPPADPQTPREREKDWVLRRLDRCIKLGTIPA